MTIIHKAILLSGVQALDLTPCADLTMKAKCQNNSKASDGPCLWTATTSTTSTTSAPPGQFDQGDVGGTCSVAVVCAGLVDGQCPINQLTALHGDVVECIGHKASDDSWDSCVTFSCAELAEEQCVIEVFGDNFCYKEENSGCRDAKSCEEVTAGQCEKSTFEDCAEPTDEGATNCVTVTETSSVSQIVLAGVGSLFMAAMF